MGIPETSLPASGEICMQVKKQQLEPDMEQRTGSKLEKEYIKAVYSHPAYVTYMHSMSCKMPGWMKHKLKLRLTGENVNNLTYADDTTHMAKSKEDLKSLLMKGKEENENVELKLNIQKKKIMASSFFISRQTDRETMETVRDFIFLGTKITADGDYSHEIKRHQLLEWKAMTNLDSISKSRHYFANKGPLRQSYGLSSSHAQMWELHYKKEESGRIEDFQLWCWKRKILESPVLQEIKSVSPKGNQSWIFIAKTDAEAETPTLVTWWEELTQQKGPWMLWKIEGRRRYRQQRIKWVYRITNSMDLNLSKLQELVMDREAKSATIQWVTKSQIWLSDWTDFKLKLTYKFLFPIKNNDKLSWNF